MRAAALPLSLLLAGCAGVSTADLDIGENSYFIANVPNPQPGDMPVFLPGELRFFMAKYDPESSRASSWEYDMPKAAADGSRWFVIAVSPGDYVIMGLGVFQGGLGGGATWSVCYGESTLQYAIGKDEAVYLGRIDASPSLVQLVQQVSDEGRAKVKSGAFAFVHDDIGAPRIVPETEDMEGLARARAALAERHPGKSGLPLRHGAPTPASFARNAPTRFSMTTCGG